MEVRGEVRRLADVFAEGEVEKASGRLRSAADSHRQTLHTLETFLQENQKLIKLVQELPTKVSYPIMVPFGKAAFFPGKLVHTNEFLVLLGEGYYAECSAFKTLEILSRRENLLSSQITGVKSQLADLDVESRFFNETLAEAAAGVVEIREELVEPTPSTPSSSMSTLESGSDLSTIEREKLQKGIPATLPKIHEELDVIMRKGEMVQLTDRDEEHERIMARLDEIEAAEAAAEMSLRMDGHATSTNVEIEHGGLKSGGLVSCFMNENTELQDVSFTGGKHVLETTNIEQSRGESAKVDGHERLGHGQRPKISTPGDLLKFEEWRRSESMKEASKEAPEAKLGVPMPSPPNVKVQERLDEFWPPKNLASVPGKDNLGSSMTSIRKAFSGTVVERSGPTPPIKISEAESEVPQRPVSKFKMRQQSNK